MSNDFATVSIEKHERMKKVMPDEEPKTIFMISPVRKLTPEIEKELLLHARKYENMGWKVHLPYRDTKQEQSGLEICEENREAIAKAEEVHIYYIPESTGSKFDLGVVFALRKKLVLINEIKRPEEKSFQQVVYDYIQNKEWEI